ncbi:M14 family metallopeptidase [Mesonia aquimarina]|uniref:M14 family metallopeptidase n=1 Tax=Mesonia aquimarina TaxID=1504967 RepID=UPI000EF59049|nr:M14 family metallopeptidase [Mesonia aquimarina]
MKKVLLFFLITSLASCDFSKYRLVKEYDFTTRFEKSEGKETATYPEIIKFYKDLDDAFTSISMEEYGETDSGKSLHLVIYNPDKDFDFKNLQKDKNILFINNGIHPGESDGIDATMMMLRDFAQDSIELPENTIIATIPVYNIGGALNRNFHSRTNQNGPKAYGFRGNAQNYDLNRDFIKTDTKNTRAFAEIFHQLKPDFFIDNHVSNGADYQYTLTHLFTQYNKLSGKLGSYLEESFRVQLEDSLAKKDWPITPYVNVFNESPEVGFSQFLDNPRYSTGYASLWNTPGMMVETHMLKPYKKRVKGTYELMLSAIKILDNEGRKIKNLKTEADSIFQQKNEYYFNYEVDSSKTSTLAFKGYEAEKIKSKITGKDRLKYDRNKPYTKDVNYYNSYKPSDTVSIPKAYIIPQAWWKVIDLLKLNQIEMTAFEKDSIMEVEAYRIEDYQTRENAYEGHYPHFATKVSSSTKKVKFRKGDFIVATNQRGIRYLLETLEPMAVDSFFNWNFFDSILQQKEHFSPYVFEDLAWKLLQENPKLKEKYEAKKKTDQEFSDNWYAQLDWIHKQTSYYEEAHLEYPVFRMLN